MTWENGRELTTATSGNTNLSFTYDGEGIRTSKTVNGVEHKYYYSGGKLLRETYGSNILDFAYNADGSLYSLRHNGTYYYYVTNLQGDVIGIVDANGNTVASYEYDPYGDVISATGTLAATNPMRYRGYYYDSETGLYYCQSRYYDPEIGRFINADVFTSTGQGILGNNMFAYCGNNPVNRRDISGTVWETVWDIVSLVTSAAEVAINPTDPWAWAGLAGDIVDVFLPCVGGLGEIVDATRTAYRVVDTGEDIIDEALTMYRLADSTDDIKHATGAYVVLYEGGQHYIGKGGFRRAITSAENHMTDTNKVAAIIWTPTSTQKGAFVTEYLLQSTVNSLARKNEMAYNLIWSPGKNYFKALQ